MPRLPALTPAILTAVGAAFLSMIVLIGWALDNAIMRGLGEPTAAIHPMTALNFLLMATASALVFVGQPRAARIALVFPAFYLAMLLFQHITGIDSGIARLLFADKMALAPMVRRPITPVGPILVLLLLLSALVLLSSGKAKLRWWAGQMASLAFAATLLLLAFTAAKHIEKGIQFVGVTSGAGVPVLLLCLAILITVVEPQTASTNKRSPWRTLQRMQPAIIVCSVMPALILIGLRESSILSDAELYFLIVMANLTVLSILLAYVTHRANVQNRLLAGGEARLNSILGTAPDALIVTNDDLVISTYSRSAPLLWGLNFDELHGRSLDTLFDAPIALPDMDNGETGGTTSHFTTATRADGVRFPAELRLGIAEQEGERVCVAFVRDLSERMAMEDQLNGLHFQLTHLSRQNAMGELAGDIAHEINQPLTAATNYASTADYVLAQGGDTAKVRDFLTEITAQLLRAGGIISRLRAFLANREIELRRESLEAVVQDAVNLVRIGSRRVAGRLTVDIARDIPAVYVDRIQIQQVLVNLLRNSFEACDEAGREPQITITARPAGEHLVEIAVADNGVGLPEGFAERMGQRFSSTKGESGLGIGLNISKRIVEAHGGTLVADNCDPRGAVFRFTMPALTESTPSSGALG